MVGGALIGIEPVVVGGVLTFYHRSLWARVPSPALGLGVVPP